MDSLKYLEFAWARRKTKYGLLLLGVAVGYGATFVLSPFQFGIVLRVGIYTLLEALLFVGWRYSSGRSIQSTDKILVVYSLRAANADAQRVLSTTIDQLTLKLDQLGLRSRFKIIELGSDAITDVSEAQRFSNRHRLNLLIHGTVTSGYVDSVHHFDLTGFFFTTRVQGLPETSPLLQLILADLNLFTSNRPWIIDQTNDLRDIKKIASGLTEIVLSTTAIGLSLRPDTVETALVLMEALLPILERRAKETNLPVKINQAKKLVYIPLDVLRSGRLRAMLCNIYLARSRYFLETDNYPAAIDAATKGLDKGAERMAALAAMAIGQYREGKENDAEAIVDQMGQIDRRHPVYLVDKAFFDIRNGRYNEALSCYKTLEHVGLSEESSIAYEVITFLSEAVTSYETECAFEFAIGFMQFHFGDRKEGEDYLGTFISKATGDERYESMIEYAKGLKKEDV